MKLLGLVGTNGSGKTTACGYLKEKGFSIFSLSNIIRNVAKERGLPLDRDALTQLGNDLKAAHGTDYLAREAYNSFAAKQKSSVAFDSVRHVDEVLFLKEKGAIMIGFDAPIAIRFERIQARQSTTDNVTFKDFKRQDDHERFGQSSGQNINGCLSYCDHKINNVGGLREFRGQLDAVLALL